MPARIGDLLAVVENRFIRNELNCHEVGLYFAIELPESVTGVDDPISVDQCADLEFRWYGQDELWNLDVRPLPVKELLMAKIVEFRHAY